MAVPGIVQNAGHGVHPLSQREHGGAAERLRHLFANSQRRIALQNLEQQWDIALPAEIGQPHHGANANMVRRIVQIIEQDALHPFRLYPTVSQHAQADQGPVAIGRIGLL